MKQFPGSDSRSWLSSRMRTGCRNRKHNNNNKKARRVVRVLPVVGVHDIADASLPSTFFRKLILNTWSQGSRGLLLAAEGSRLSVGCSED